jgi:hypothetical protein
LPSITPTPSGVLWKSSSILFLIFSLICYKISNPINTVLGPTARVGLGVGVNEGVTLIVGVFVGVDVGLGVGVGVKFVVTVGVGVVVGVAVVVGVFVGVVLVVGVGVGSAQYSSYSKSSGKIAQLGQNGSYIENCDFNSLKLCLISG